MSTATTRTVQWFASSDDPERVLAIFPTTLGWMGFEWSCGAVQRSVFGHASPRTVCAAWTRSDLKQGDRWQPIVGRQVDRAASQLAVRLQRFAADPTDDLSDVPIASAGLSRFQQRVLRACRKIRPGRTSTYRELAVQAGSPGAARAAGNVMANNRFAPIVPCHRVLASGGGLGGYSAPAGLPLKRQLLAAEARSGRTQGRRPPV